jgi:hypothetical protein
MFPKNGIDKYGHVINVSDVTLCYDVAETPRVYICDLGIDIPFRQAANK